MNLSLSLSQASLGIGQALGLLTRVDMQGMSLLSYLDPGCCMKAKDTAIRLLGGQATAGVVG